MGGGGDAEVWGNREKKFEAGFPEPAAVTQGTGEGKPLQLRENLHTSLGFAGLTPSTCNFVARPSLKPAGVQAPNV